MQPQNNHLQAFVFQLSPPTNSLLKINEKIDIYAVSLHDDDCNCNGSFCFGKGTASIFVTFSFIFGPMTWQHAKHMIIKCSVSKAQQ